jgi:hypothetical protein
MLNPLADAAQTGESVLLVYVHPPAIGLNVAGVVNAVQNALNNDTNILPGGFASGYQANDGTVWVGASFVVPDQSGSDEEGTVLYDDLFQPIKFLLVVPTDGFASVGGLLPSAAGAVLAFVDYGSNSDAVDAAQTGANAENAAQQAGSTAAIGGTPYWVTAMDSLGAITPYAQQAWSLAINVGQAENTTTGKVANDLQTALDPFANLPWIVAGLVLGAFVLNAAISGIFSRR